MEYCCSIPPIAYQKLQKERPDILLFEDDEDDEFSLAEEDEIDSLEMFSEIDSEEYKSDFGYSE